LEFTNTTQNHHQHHRYHNRLYEVYRSFRIVSLYSLSAFNSTQETQLNSGGNVLQKRVKIRFEAEKNTPTDPFHRNMYTYVERAVKKNDRSPHFSPRPASDGPADAP